MQARGDATWGLGGEWLVYCAYPPLFIIAKHVVWSSSSESGKLHHASQIQCNPLFWYIVVTQSPLFIHIFCVASFVPPQDRTEPVWVVKPEHYLALCRYLWDSSRVPQFPHHYVAWRVISSSANHFCHQCSGILSLLCLVYLLL